VFLGHFSLEFVIYLDSFIAFQFLPEEIEREENPTVWIYISTLTLAIYRDLVRLLGGAVAGMHSMVDEHFGISVVEYMAAGAMPIGGHFNYFFV
jgi:hypothetical protein